MSNKKKPDKNSEELDKTAKTSGEEAVDGVPAGEESVELLRDTVERFSKEAHALAVELADEKEKCLRILAEYDNFRKRSQKERENIYSDIRGDTLLKFLPVYDNLERALNQETADEAYRRGVEMIMTQFKDIMASLGVTEIKAEPGEKFDPEFHDAVMHVEDDSLDEGVIVEQLQRGFKLGDKVLRFSMVKTAN